jgi:hypothetical protein
MNMVSDLESFQIFWAIWFFGLIGWSFVHVIAFAIVKVYVAENRGLELVSLPSKHVWAWRILTSTYPRYVAALGNPYAYYVVGTTLVAWLIYATTVVWSTPVTTVYTVAVVCAYRFWMRYTGGYVHSLVSMKVGLPSWVLKAPGVVVV